MERIVELGHLSILTNEYLVHVCNQQINTVLLFPLKKNFEADQKNKILCEILYISQNSPPATPAHSRESNWWIFFLPELLSLTCPILKLSGWHHLNSLLK